MALDYKIWQGIGALNTYCGVTSAWRSSILFYIALRSKHDYFFAPLEELAKGVGCSHDTAASVMNDLIEVGAVELIAYADLPGWIRKLHPRYNPNKKYWHVTGEYTIADVTYQYKWNGDAGEDVVSEKIVDVVSEKIVANNIIQNKINGKETTLVAQQVETTVADPLSTPIAIEDDTLIDERLDFQPISETRVKLKIQSPKPKTEKTPLIVNLSNEKLGRTRPPNFTDAAYADWLKIKPVWSLFADWQVMNLTNGNCHYADYETQAHPLEWQRIVNEVQQMGKWLDALAKKAQITLTYEWVLGWKRWYDANVMNQDITKYPTRKDTFEKNFTLYVDYLFQQSKKEPNRE